MKANNGSAGIDGITIDQMEDYLRKQWRPTKKLIKQRTYKPQPVLRVEIPKPNGGIRQLGIPTVMDRIIQQAIVQVLGPICEPYFSEMSYGFRPNRSCEKAIVKLLEYLNDGYEWLVAIDLDSRIEKLKWLIRGWITYFALSNTKTAMAEIDERLRTRIRVIIWKEWKKKSRRPWGLLKRRVQKWIAAKVSGWGDHYQLVAQKSVLKRAISKPVLVKRGLVS